MAATTRHTMIFQSSMATTSLWLSSCSDKEASPPTKPIRHVWAALVIWRHRTTIRTVMANNSWGRAHQTHCLLTAQSPRIQCLNGVRGISKSHHHQLQAMAYIRTQTATFNARPLIPVTRHAPSTTRTAIVVLAATMDRPSARPTTTAKPPKQSALMHTATHTMIKLRHSSPRAVLALRSSFAPVEGVQLSSVPDQARLLVPPNAQAAHLVLPLAGHIRSLICLSGLADGLCFRDY